MLLEEGLDVLQKALTSLLLFKPASASLEGDFQGPVAWGEARKPAKKSAATRSMLLARFNQLCKFAVNFISDCGVEEVEEEVEESSLEAVQGLATALLTMWLDIEAGIHRSGDTLVKGLQDGAGLAGVLLLHLLQSPGLPRRRRISLVRRLDTPQLLPTVEKLFPAAAGREALRLALAQLAAEAGILSSVDSDLVISLYGRLLSKRLFPQGPGQGQHEGPVRHQSYGPWLAERDRCSKVEEVMAARREERGGREAGRLTGEVVRLHDRLTREQLEREREQLCSQHRAAVAWSKLLERQTAPLGSWHRPASQPRSLVLENICGTSGTFLRLRRGHCGLTKDRYFLPGSEHLAEELVPGNLLLSEPETVQIGRAHV